MTKNLDRPPKMREPYSQWKLELELWSEMTDYKESQIGSVIALSLEGDARDAVLSIGKENLKSAEGYKLIVEKLDSLYAKDDSQMAYLTIDQFFKYRRPLDMPVDEFLRKFELLKTRVEAFNLKIDEHILAYLLINCANMPEKKTDVVKACMKELTFKEIRAKIVAIYSEISSESTTTNSDSSYGFEKMSIKDESGCSSQNASPVYYGHNQNQYHYNKRRGRGRGSNRYGNGRNQYRHQPSNSPPSHPPQRAKENPKDKDSDKESRCEYCGSKFH